jgi:hypothetical protein
MPNAPTQFYRAADSLREAGDNLQHRQHSSAGDDLRAAAEHTRQAAHGLADLETIVRARSGLVAKLLGEVTALRDDLDEIKRALAGVPLPWPGNDPPAEHFE